MLLLGSRQSSGECNPEGSGKCRKRVCRLGVRGMCSRDRLPLWLAKGFFKYFPLQFGWEGKFWMGGTVESHYFLLFSLSVSDFFQNEIFIMCIDMFRNALSNRTWLPLKSFHPSLLMLLWLSCFGSYLNMVYLWTWLFPGLACSFLLVFSTYFYY